MIPVYRLIRRGKMQYKVGQIITSTHEVELETVLPGEKVKVPAGNKVIIGADKLAHHIRSGMIQPVSKEIQIDGYDVSGLAEYLVFYLKNKYPMEDFFEDYDIEESDFKDELEFALYEIGF